MKPNSKLDIYNAYVQNKATLKADTITAQVYDISDDSVAGQKELINTEMKQQDFTMLTKTEVC